MKYFEQLIIGSALSEDRFNEVSFLEAKDFKHYSNYWQLALNCKGDLATMIKAYPEDIQNRLITISTLLSVSNPSYFAFKLVQTRFETLFSTLLYNLSESTKNVLESNILIEAKNSIGHVDIFDLSDGLIEYIGYQITEETEQRIKDFINYRDNRMKRIKNHGA